MATAVKTKVNDASVTDFLDKVSNETRRTDCYAVMRVMQKVTGKKPKMWGGSIVGFDEYHYKYESGHEGDICMIGFSPRAQALTLYVLHDIPERAALLSKLGRHKTGKGCLYINKLADVDLEVLEKLIRTSYQWIKTKHS